MLNKRNKFKKNKKKKHFYCKKFGCLKKKQYLCALFRPCASCVYLIICIYVYVRNGKSDKFNGKIINKQTYNEANLLFDGLHVLAADELAGADEGNGYGL